MRNNKQKTNHRAAVVISGLLFLLIVCLAVREKPELVSAWAHEEGSVSSSDFWSGISHSDLRVRLTGGADAPATVFRKDRQPVLRAEAAGVLSHVTSAGAEIRLSDLLVELGLAEAGTALDTARTVGLTVPDCLETSALADGDTLIRTKWSFDTLEEVVLAMGGGNTTVIFKDSRYATDIQDLCTDVVLTVNGHTYSQDTVWGDETIYVSPKKLYMLDVTFSERADKQFSAYEPLEFDLPQGFILPEDFNSQNHTLSINMDLSGILEGNTIRTDETRTKVYVDWNRNDEEKFNALRDASRAQFTLTLQGYLDLQNGRFLFSTDKGLTLKQENLHNAIVHKTVDYIPYQMMYEILVESDGTTENLTLTDVMGTALIQSDDVTMAFENGAHEGDEEYEPKLVSNRDGRMVIRIPRMDDEDVLSIRYTATVDIDKIQRSGNATEEETGNTATLTGDSDPSDNVETAYVPGVSFSNLDKTGKDLGNISENGSRFGHIRWKIDMNKGAVVTLAGTDVSDYIGDAYLDDSRYYGEGIHVVCQNKKGEVCAERDIPWEDLGVDPATDKRWIYPVPEDDPKYEYIITYETVVSLLGKTDSFIVDNFVSGKCGEDKAAVMIYPKGPGDVGVYKYVDDLQSNQVTWGYNLTVKNNALKKDLKLTEYQPKTGGIAEGELPRSWVDSYTVDGVTYPGRFYQENVRRIEVSGLMPGETVVVTHKYKEDVAGQTYTVSRTKVHTATAGEDGVVVFSDFDDSSQATSSPQNYVVMQFYKNEAKEDGLQEPADGSKTRNLLVKMTNTFSQDWVNAVEYYLAERGSYRPYYFDHTNYVEFTAGADSDSAIATFTPQPVSIYKQLVVDGTAPKNTGTENPVDEDGNVYPVYRFRLAVKGVNTNDPLVIDDVFDTTLFKMFDMRDFGGSRTTVESVVNGVHEVRYINWLKPTFAGQEELGWNSVSNDNGYVYSTNSMHSNDELVQEGKKTYRMIWDDAVIAQETDTGVRFTFRDMSLFKKSNGEFYDYYVVEYYLVPKNLQALARLESRIQENPQSNQTTFENVAKCRGKETKATSPYRHKNNLLPVTKDWTPDSSSGSVQHPRLKFDIKINPGAMTLNEGKNMVATDTYSDSLAIDFTSIKVTAKPPEKLSEVSYDFSHNVGTYIIPDNTYVHITYSATIIAEPAANEVTVPFSNKVKVGDYSSEASDNIKVTSDSQGSAITPVINILKYCSGHMERALQGAVFQLLDANKQPIISSKTGLPITRTTDEKGLIKLRLSETIDGASIEPDTYYFIREVSAPEDYYKSTVDYQFMIRSDGKVDYSADARAYLNGDTLTVRDVPKAIDLELTKTLMGNVKLTEADLDDIRFTLERKVGDEWVPYAPVRTNADDEPYPADPAYTDVAFSGFSVDPNPDPNAKPKQDGEEQDPIVGHFRFDYLTPGDYRLVESSEQAVLDRHSNTHFSVKYHWDNGDNGKALVMPFTVTQDHLYAADNRKVSVTNTYNKATVNKNVAKKWLDADGSEINWPEGLSVSLEVFSRYSPPPAQEGEDPPAPVDTSVRTIELDGKTDDTGETTAGTASFIGLPKYYEGSEEEVVYYVKETTQFNGYLTSQAEYLLDEPDTTIYNIKQKTQSLTVTKKWGATLPEGAFAELSLYAYENTATPASARLIEKRRAVPPDGSSVNNPEPWIVQFEDLDDVSDRDVPLVYFVKETDCTFRYEPTYPEGKEFASDGEEIVNRVATVGFEVTKQWKNTPDNEWPAGMSITLYLHRMGEPASTEEEPGPDPDFAKTFVAKDGVLISSPDGVTCHMEKTSAGRYLLVVEELEKYAENGRKWIYLAEEEPITSYLVGYTDHNRSARPSDATSGGYIINEPELYSLTLQKRVAGNFASKWRTFDFTVTLTKPNGALFEGNVRTEITHLSGDSDIVTVPFVKGQGTVSLRHGDIAVLDKLLAGSTFEVTEADTGGSYTVTVQVDGADAEEATGTLNRNRTVAFLNERNALLPTGVKGGIVASAVLLALAGSALILTLSLRRRTKRRY